jgi:hypothetical protein
MQTPEVWDFLFITVSPVSKTMPNIIGTQLIFIVQINGLEVSD